MPRQKSTTPSKRKGRPNPATTKHGMSHSAEYRAWKAMHTRCYNPNYCQWRTYGGRGIVVCERWHSFENFYGDMGARPSPQHSLDRRDNDGPYSPENCRWIPLRQQAWNKTTTRWLTLNGESKPLKVWARQLGIDDCTLRQRLRKGWSDHETLTTQVLSHHDCGILAASHHAAHNGRADDGRFHRPIPKGETGRAH